MNKEYDGSIHDIAGNESMENFYQKFILPEFGVVGDVWWGRHVRTGPDNFLHLFLVGGSKYVLAFDDYPNGFSVGSDMSVRALCLPGGEKILHVSVGSKYAENVTGSFMLFQVVDGDEFDALVEYLESVYARQRRKWDSECKNVIVVARDVLQLAETASQNHDSTSLYSLKNIIEAFLSLDASDNEVELRLLKKYVEILVDAEFGYEFFSPEEKEAVVASELYKSLSEGLRHTMTIRKYKLGHLGEMIKLVSAMYAKEDAGTTAGMSITITCEGDKIAYPVEHFINGELREYFAKNCYITGRNVEQHLPSELGGYSLVAGSERVDRVFRYELDHVEF